MINTATDNLEWILDRWEQLMETRLPGTPRPWKQPELSREQREEMDRQARIEKIEHGAFVLGESEAPLNLDVLDKAGRITTTVQSLAYRMAQELRHDAMAVLAARAHYTGPQALIGYLAAHVLETSEETQERVRRTTQRIRAIMANHFAEVFDGQRLKTDCPWCHKPKMFIRMIGPEHDRIPIIACESGVCDPPSADCGPKRIRGNPFWPFHEWDWLGDRMDHANAKTA